MVLQALFSLFINRIKKLHTNLDEIFRIVGHSAKEELITYWWWSGLFDCHHKGNFVLLWNIMLKFGWAHVLKVRWHVGEIVILGRGRQSLSAFLWLVLPIIYYTLHLEFLSICIFLYQEIDMVLYVVIIYLYLHKIRSAKVYFIYEQL